MLRANNLLEIWPLNSLLVPTKSVQGRSKAIGLNERTSVCGFANEATCFFVVFSSHRGSATVGLVVVSIQLSEQIG